MVFITMDFGDKIEFWHGTKDTHLPSLMENGVSFNVPSNHEITGQKRGLFVWAQRGDAEAYSLGDPMDVYEGHPAIACISMPAVPANWDYDYEMNCQSVVRLLNRLRNELIPLGACVPLDGKAYSFNHDPQKGLYLETAHNTERIELADNLMWQPIAQGKRLEQIAHFVREKWPERFNANLLADMVKAANHEDPQPFKYIGHDVIKPSTAFVLHDDVWQPHGQTMPPAGPGPSAIKPPSL